MHMSNILTREAMGLVSTSKDEGCDYNHNILTKCPFITDIDFQCSPVYIIQYTV